MRYSSILFFFFVFYLSVAPVGAYEHQDIDTVLNHARYLSVSIGARDAGTIGEREAAAYISNKLEEYDLTVDSQNFSGQSQQLRYIKIDQESGDESSLFKEEMQTNETIFSQNIIGVKKGTSDKIILLTAHYDSYGGPGANDNAAGVGVLLQIAQTLQNQSINNSIWFVFFGAEEVGLLGSTKFLESLSGIETKNILGVINVDTIGVGNTLEPGIFSTREGNLVQTPPWLLKSLLDETNKKKINIELDTSDINKVMLKKRSFDKIQGKSDFVIFLTAGIPAIGIGYDDLKLEYAPYVHIHSENDTIDKLSKKNIGEINEVILAMVLNMDMSDYFDRTDNGKYFIWLVGGNLLTIPTNDMLFLFALIALAVSAGCFIIYSKLNEKRRIGFLIGLSSLFFIVITSSILENIDGWMVILISLSPLVLNIVGLTQKNRHLFLASSVLITLFVIILIIDPLFNNRIDYFRLIMPALLLIPALIQLIPKYK